MRVEKHYTLGEIIEAARKGRKIFCNGTSFDATVEFQLDTIIEIELWATKGLVWSRIYDAPAPSEPVAMLSCKDVAKYFLLIAAIEEQDDLISNLKLQKLVYYAQGFHLAIHGDVLFPEPIRAWEHGPVVPDLYHEYKQHGKNAIPVDVTFDSSILSLEIQELLDDVYRVYGQFSAWRLREMTHIEPPYAQTFYGQIISTDKMKDYFKTQLN